MQIKVDDEVVYEFSDTAKKIFCNDIHAKEFSEDIKRRVVYIIMEKYRFCFDRLKKEWDPKLAQRGIEMIPTNQEKYAELVFSQPDYKSRSEREKDLED